MCLQAEERAEKEAQRQMEKDARNREREEAKKMARYPIEDAEVRPSLSLNHFGSPAGTVILTGACIAATVLLTAVLLAQTF